MATPRASQHRDLEQRFRNIETQLRKVTTKALSRPQATVTSGDLVVSGGGGVVVRDGGHIKAYEGDETGERFEMDASGDMKFYTGQLDGFGNETFGILYQIGDTIRLAAPQDTVTELPAAIWLNGGSVPSVELFGQVHAPDVNSTGNGANVFWRASDGRLLVNTSTRRHKADIRPAELDTDAVLQLEPQTFTRPEDEGTPDEGRRYVGFIAEDADALGLAPWVSYDEGGKPWAFDYSQWCVALQVVARRQAEQLAEQAETIKALSARLDALEGAS